MLFLEKGVLYSHSVKVKRWLTKTKAVHFTGHNIYKKISLY
jgi:hypothetical protein